MFFPYTFNFLSVCCRFHATVVILVDNQKAAKLILRDHRSTFGTFVNERKIGTELDIILNDGDRLKFGAQESNFLVRSFPLAICSTRLDRQTREKLKVVSFIFILCLNVLLLQC